MPWNSTRSGWKREHVPGRAISRGAGVWVIVAAAVLAAALSTVPGSLALWNDADTVDAGTVSSGRLDAAIAPGTTIPTTGTVAQFAALTGVIPGESRTATFTVRNTGNVPIQIAAVRNDSTNQYLILDLAPGICPTLPASGVVLSATPANVGTAIAPATNATFCLRITLDANTPGSLQGTSLGLYGVDLTGGLR